MLHIPALVGDMLMESCHLNASLLPVGTALCFSGQLSLKAFQFLFGLLKVFGVLILYSIRGDRIGFDTQDVYKRQA